MTRTVPFGEALRFWLKLGFISFGGPAGQIAIMHREVVERRRWISEERFLHALNYCILLPGPEAQQLATYIGWLLHRTWGGIVAGGLFVLPSVFILAALSYVYAAHGSVPVVASALSGVKPIVVAVVAEALLKIGSRALTRMAHVLLAIAAFLAMHLWNLPFPLIIVVAGLIGLAGMHRWPEVFAASGPARPASQTSNPAAALPTLVIDDEAPLPAHTRPSRARDIRVLVCGLALWLLPLVGLSLWRGRESLHVHEYRFFLQAALVTFGGAYSVLAYVTHAMVDTHGWLTRAQAVDGLALAETTPGPLIMVLQFIGYLAAWNRPEGMAPWASALVGAAATTYAMFLPCFFFIFLGAPYAEALRGHRGLTAALTGVTAAVVGVIADLALVFGAAVIWPSGEFTAPNLEATLFTLAALAALVRFKIDIVWVVLAGGLLGVVLHWS